MSDSNKKMIGALAGVGVALAGWAGASIYGGSAAEKEIRAIAARPSSETGVRISKLQHDGGLFSSTGSFQLEIVNQCASAIEGAAPTLELQYTLSHLILPSSATRVEWSAKPSGELATELATVFGPGLALQGKGDVSFGGNFSSVMSLPELAIDKEGNKLTISPSSGRLMIGKAALGITWNIDKLVARGHGQALELAQMALNVDLSNRYLGTGSTSFGIEKIATGYGSAEGFRHATNVTENGDRLDAQITESLRSATFSGVNAKDLSLEFAVKNLDKQSVETIGRLFGDTCGLQNITEEEGTRFRKALRTLIAQGFSVGIPKLVGTVGTGSIEGKLMLEARKGDAGGQISLAKMLRSSGELIVKGEAITAEQKQMALAMGAAEEIPGALKASFEYSDGMLRANGRVFDGGQVQKSLRSADLALNTFINATQMAKAAPPAVPAGVPAEPETPAPVAVAPLEAPTAAPTPVVAAAPAAPVPVAAPAADCTTPRQCLPLALKAAANEDVDTVRSLATRIEGFGKPDLGNRAVSRKLNSEGLEALKADQPAAAADLFRKGLAENPRDVELAGNLGFALVKAGKAAEAVEVLTAALQLDPRRSSTWTPLAEALALAGNKDESLAALWIAFQWSGNRDKSLAFYADRAEKEQATRPALAEMYKTVLGWVSEGRRPKLGTLASL